MKGDAFKRVALLCQSFKSNGAYQAVNKTRKQAQADDGDTDFGEGLSLVSTSATARVALDQALLSGTLSAFQTGGK